MVMLQRKMRPNTRNTSVCHHPPNSIITNMTSFVCIICSSDARFLSAKYRRSREEITSSHKYLRYQHQSTGVFSEPHDIWKLQH